MSAIFSLSILQLLNKNDTYAVTTIFNVMKCGYVLGRSAHSQTIHSRFNMNFFTQRDTTTARQLKSKRTKLHKQEQKYKRNATAEYKPEAAAAAA